MTHTFARMVVMAMAFFCAVVSAAAQTTAIAAAPPAVAEHYGIGGFGALGWPGPVVAIRASAPLAPRFGVDIDVGRGRESREPTGVFGAQLRWLRRERREDGTSDYVILGVVVMNETTRGDIRFPDARIVITDRAMRLFPQVGYGIDWQGRGGTRVGMELAGGGAGEALRPRLFLRVFTVWGRRIARG